MREDALALEAGRMTELTIETYPWFHERHRAFPEIFEDRGHIDIIDLAAGIGVVAKRITENYQCNLTCNEIDQNCIKQLNRLDVNVTSFDLDIPNDLPLESESFDAVLSLVVLEHIIHTDNLIKEMKRILRPHGRLYLSVPNCASIFHMLPLLKGRSVHDPLDETDRYEFYAHVRYFAFYTLIDLFEHLGFFLDTAYLTLPKESTRYKNLKERSKLKSFLFKHGASFVYSLSPRWHPGPIMCFAKQPVNRKPHIIKI